MAQAFLLKTDVAMISSNVSQKYVKNQAADTDDRKIESFSSTLDTQVDKQAIQHQKKLNGADDTGDNVETKSEISGEKSGKVLPDDLAESTEKVVDTDDSQNAASAEASFSLPTEKVESEILSDDALTSAINAGEKSDDAINVGHHTVLTQVEQADVTKKNVIDTSTKVQLAETSKLTGDIAPSNKVETALTDQENENVEQKQQAQSLRSDILNALLKKTTNEGEKIASMVEQKIVASSTTITPIISKEGLSEEQQIMALANNGTLKGSLSTGNIFERSAAVSSLLLTPASTSSQVTGSTAVASQPSLNLQPALQSEAWSRVLSSRVIWMAREGIQQASLKLNPANMGPVEVKLHIHNDQANISFIAHHAATRDALEQALPRLRESFQENGMELAHADVSQENFSQTDEQDNNKTTDNGSTSERDNVNTDNESTTHDVNITEQDIAMGLSVFA